MTRSTLRPILAVAVLGTVATATLPAYAADWQFNPLIEVGGQTDTNYRLNLPAVEDSVSGGFADVQLELRRAGQVNDFRMTPGVHATHFSAKSHDSSTDPSLRVDFTHRGLKSTAGFIGAYSKESVARTDRGMVDIVGGGLGNPTPGDSGYITIRDRRQLAQGSPTLSYELWQRSHLLLAANYFKADYDHEVPGLYVGYTNLDGSVGVARDISVRTTLIVRTRYAHYTPNGLFASADSTGLEAEWDRHVSQVAQAYVRVGGVRTSFGQQAGTSSAAVTSVIAGAGVNWTYQTTKLFVDATRTVDPNATGYSVVRDQLRLRVEKALTQKFTAIVGVRGYHDTATGKQVQYRTRDYMVGTLGARWQFERAWTLAGEYSYTRQKYQNDPTAAISNAGLLSVIYRPNPKD